MSPSSDPSSDPSSSPSNSPSSLPSKSPSSQPSNIPSMFILLEYEIVVSKVIIESTTGEPIHLVEFEVLTHSENVALRGIATNSLDYDERYNASKAIDGDNFTFSLTYGVGAKWELHLDDMYPIQGISVINGYCGIGTGGVGTPAPTQSPTLSPTISISTPVPTGVLDTPSPSISFDPGDCLCRLSYATITFLDDNDAVVARRRIGNTCGEQNVTFSFSPTTFSRISTGDDGRCLDHHGNEYSYVRKYFPGNATARECGSWCLLQNPDSPIAFEFYDDPDDKEDKCYCLYNEGLPAEIGTFNPDTFDPMYSRIRLGEAGVGPISSVSGDSNWFCYQNDVSLLATDWLKPQLCSTNSRSCCYRIIFRPKAVWLMQIALTNKPVL